MIENRVDRPDLFLAEIEKHDPGFIKRMNEATEVRATRTEKARFHCGKHQAYSALFLSVFSALAVLAALIVLILTEQATFWNFLGIGAFYAITQG